MRTYLRTVTYEIRAESPEDALEAWDMHGPQGPLAAGRVRTVASSNIEEHETAHAPHGDPEFMPRHA